MRADKYNLTATDGLNVGSKLDFTLPDQFDKPHSLSSDTKNLILSFSKASGHAVKEFLKKEPKEFLEQHKTMFIADISPMPVVIRNTLLCLTSRQESTSQCYLSTIRSWQIG